MIAAKLLVITTRLTVGAFFLIAFKSPVVPMMAGSKLRWKVQFQPQSARVVTTEDTHQEASGANNRYTSDVSCHTCI